MATRDPSLYGLLAEFSGPEELLSAARRVRDAGYTKTDAYAPFPVHGLAEALGMRRTIMPYVVLLGGIIGALAGYGLQFYVCVIAYPLNVGGRPTHSVPAFIPVTFETTILIASLFGVLGMLALNGLPTPNHPLFGVKRFDRASLDGFFLCVEARDAKFDAENTRALLEELTPKEVVDVPI